MTKFKGVHKMKKIISLILVCCIAVGILPITVFVVRTSAATSGYYTYEVSNGSAAITAVSSDISGDVVIPDTLGDCPVTKIDSGAFEGCYLITSITIPEGVTSIGNGVFMDCTSLTNATVYSHNATFGTSVFHNTAANFALYAYTSSTAEAYAEANGHTFVALPEEGVTASGTCGDNLTWTLYDDGELVIDGTGVMNDHAYDNLPPYYEYREKITSVTVGEGVTSIGNYAFGDFGKLVSVSIPDSVTCIGQYALTKCTSLTGIHIPDSVTNIKAYALSYCYNIADIYYGGCRAQWDKLSAENMLGNRFDYITGSKTESGAYALHFEEINYAVVSAPSEGNDGSYYDIYAGSEFIKSARISLPQGQAAPGAVYEYDLEDDTYKLSNCIDSENYYIFGLFNALVADDGYAKMIYYAADSFNSGDLSSLTYHAYSGNHFTNGETIADMESSIGSRLDGKLQFTDGKTNGSCDGLRLCTDDDTVFYFISSEGGEDDASASRTVKQYIGSGKDRYIDFDNATRIYSDGIGTESTASLVLVIDAKDNDFSTVTPDTPDVPDVPDVPDNPDIPSSPSGEVGSLKWTISADGEMVIEGDGALTDITVNTPWSESRDTITALTVGSGVTDIDNIAFSFCKNLTAINVDAANENYTSIGGILYTKDGKTVVGYPSGKTDTSYDIPEGTVTVESYAFRGCENLISVTLPDSVTAIGNYAFWGCEGIEDITLGKSVSEIGAWTFAYCGSLTAIFVDTDNENYTSVDGVLYSKDMTALISYPANKAGDSYSIPEGVTRITNYAFAGCTDLVSVTIPATVKVVGNCVFDDCTKLTSINVANGNKRYIALDGVLYNSDMTTLLYYPAGRSDTEFTVPETVTSVGRYAFSDCDNLVTVNISTNVTSIGYSAFSYCDKLTAINYAGTEAEWASIEKGNYWNRYLDGDEVKFR